MLSWAEHNFFFSRHWGLFTNKNSSKLQELNRTNRQMQQRIVELLEGVPNEEVTSKL